MESIIPKSLTTVRSCQMSDGCDAMLKERARYSTGEGLPTGMDYGTTLTDSAAC